MEVIAIHRKRLMHQGVNGNVRAFMASGCNRARRQRKSKTAHRALECGDLSPLWALIRLVESAEPRFSGLPDSPQARIAICSFHGDKSPAQSGDKSPHSKGRS